MPYGDRSVWVGFDDREVAPFAVARSSLRSWCSVYTPVYGLVLGDLLERRWYTRPTEVRMNEHGGEMLWDAISEAPMSTQFAISRFFVLHLATDVGSGNGWALFVDCDILARNYIDDLFNFVETKCQDKALVCVPHNHRPDNAVKKSGQVQLSEVDPRAPGVYSRKNWSSVMLLNQAHPSNKKLTLELLNTVPGRDLHRFCWLDDSEIGHLDVKWNHLVGVEGSQSPDPSIVHFTNGGPWIAKYADVDYADEWRAAYRKWLAK